MQSIHSLLLPSKYRFTLHSVKTELKNCLYNCSIIEYESSDLVIIDVRPQKYLIWQNLNESKVRINFVNEFSTTFNFLNYKKNKCKIIFPKTLMCYENILQRRYLQMHQSSRFYSRKNKKMWIVQLYE